MALTAEQLAQFHRAGYATGGPLVEGAALTRLRRELDRLIAELPDGTRSENMRNIHYDNDFILDLLLSRPLVETAEQILGPDLLLHRTYTISKRPGDGLPVAWHQDAYYFPMKPMEVFTLWLAIDDSDRENSCMQVIPGSHRDRVIHTHRYTDTWGRTTALPLSLVERDMPPAVEVTLKAGEFSVHSPYIIHGSGPNRSRRRRCGMTIIYQTRRVQIDPDYDSPMKLDWNSIRLYECNAAAERRYRIANPDQASAGTAQPTGT